MNQPKPLPLNFVLRTWGGSYLIVGTNTVTETTDLQAATVFDRWLPDGANTALFRCGYHRHVDRVPVDVIKTIVLRNI